MWMQDNHGVAVNLANISHMHEDERKSSVLGNYGTVVAYAVNGNTFDLGRFADPAEARIWLDTFVQEHSA